MPLRLRPKLYFLWWDLPVHAKEIPQLDPNQAYPCPACKQGVLIPITLTDAWGCDRCKQIFEQRDEPNTVGKLATPYNRQRTWRWNGQQWVLGNQLIKPKAINSLAIVAFMACLLWFGLSRIALPGFLIFGILALGLLLVVMFWVLRRR